MGFQGAEFAPSAETMLKYIDELPLYARYYNLQISCSDLVFLDNEFISWLKLI